MCITLIMCITIMIIAIISGVSARGPRRRGCRPGASPSSELRKEGHWATGHYAFFERSSYV